METLSGKELDDGIFGPADSHLDWADEVTMSEVVHGETLSENELEKAKENQDDLSPGHSHPNDEHGNWQPQGMRRDSFSSQYSSNRHNGPNTAGSNHRYTHSRDYSRGSNCNSNNNNGTNYYDAAAQYNQNSRGPSAYQSRGGGSSAGRGGGYRGGSGRGSSRGRGSSIGSVRGGSNGGGGNSYTNYPLSVPPAPTSQRRGSRDRSLSIERAQMASDNTRSWRSNFGPGGSSSNNHRQHQHQHQQYASRQRADIAERWEHDKFEPSPAPPNTSTRSNRSRQFSPDESRSFDSITQQGNYSSGIRNGSAGSINRSRSRGRGHRRNSSGGSSRNEGIASRSYPNDSHNNLITGSSTYANQAIPYKAPHRRKSSVEFPDNHRRPSIESNITDGFSPRDIPPPPPSQQQPLMPPTLRDSTTINEADEDDSCAKFEWETFVANGGLDVPFENITDDLLKPNSKSTGDPSYRSRNQSRPRKASFDTVRSAPSRSSDNRNVRSSSRANRNNEHQSLFASNNRFGALVDEDLEYNGSTAPKNRKKPVLALDDDDDDDDDDDEDGIDGDNNNNGVDGMADTDRRYTGAQSKYRGYDQPRGARPSERSNYNLNKPPSRNAHRGYGSYNNNNNNNNYNNNNSRDDFQNERRPRYSHQQRGSADSTTRNYNNNGSWNNSGDTQRSRSKYGQRQQYQQQQQSERQRNQHDSYTVIIKGTATASSATASLPSQPPQTFKRTSPTTSPPASFYTNSTDSAMASLVIDQVSSRRQQRRPSVSASEKASRHGQGAEEPSAETEIKIKGARNNGVPSSSTGSMGPFGSGNNKPGAEEKQQVSAKETNSATSERRPLPPPQSTYPRRQFEAYDEDRGRHMFSINVRYDEASYAPIHVHAKDDVTKLAAKFARTWRVQKMEAKISRVLAKVQEVVNENPI